jgi:hypothetical protein
MKKVLIYSQLLCFTLLSCIRGEVITDSDLDNKMKMDSIVYSDVDLFTFQGLESKNYSEKHIKMQTFNDMIITTVFTGNKSFETIYKKNSDGYFFQVEEVNESGFIEIVYTIYSNQKIIKFFLTKFKGDEVMKLSSHRIILPIDSKRRQREITYKYKEITIKDFSKIEYLNIIKGKIEDNYEFDSYYNFDYDNKRCTYGMIDEGKFIVNNVFEIGNAKSVASPLYRFWRVTK